MSGSLDSIALDLENTQEQLSATLKKLRKTAHITTTHLSRKTGISRPTISRIESGIRVPTIEESDQLLKALKASEQDCVNVFALVRTLRSTSGNLRTLTRGPGHHIQTALADTEKRVSNLSHYQPTYVPGLLQTTAYAKAVIFGSLVELTPEVAMEALRVRIQRQEALFDLDKSFQFIISPIAFRAPFVSESEMRAQCNHLCAFSGSENVRIGIVDEDFVFRSEMVNFIIYDDVLVAAGTVFGQIQSSEDQAVAQCKRMFEMASRNARWGEEAFSYLREIQDGISSRLIDVR